MPASSMVRAQGRGWKSMNAIKKCCSQCGVKFTVSPSREATARFCSWACRIKHQRRDVGAADKWCPGCRATKPRAMFSKNTSNSDGNTSQCRECSALLYKKWADKNKGKISARCAQNKESRNANSIRWQRGNPTKVKIIPWLWG